VKVSSHTPCLGTTIILSYDLPLRKLSGRHRRPLSLLNVFWKDKLTTTWCISSESKAHIWVITRQVGKKGRNQGEITVWQDTHSTRVQFMTGDRREASVKPLIGG
jgi:hypothetical protein